MPFSFGKTSRERMAGIHPDLIKVLELAIIITKVDLLLLQHGGIIMSFVDEYGNYEKNKRYSRVAIW